jgi:hypothetical protein
VLMVPPANCAFIKSTNEQAHSGQLRYFFLSDTGAACPRLCEPSKMPI